MTFFRNHTKPGFGAYSSGKWCVTIRDHLIGVRLGLIWRDRVVFAWRYR
jgi:hypothetical protein